MLHLLRSSWRRASVAMKRFDGKVLRHLLDVGRALGQRILMYLKALTGSLLSTDTNTGRALVFDQFSLFSIFLIQSEVYSLIIAIWH